MGGGRTKAVVARRIDQTTATQLANERRLLVTPAVDYDGVIDLWPRGPLSTLGEVRALAAFMARTDAPVRWHAYPGGGR